MPNLALSLFLPRRKWDSPILRKILIGVTSQFGALFIAQPLHIAHVRMVVDLGTGGVNGHVGGVTGFLIHDP